MAGDQLLERTFRAMGGEAEVLVTGPVGDGVLDEVGALIEGLEARWSRFRPDSELSVLNRLGAASGLSAPTYALIEDAIDAWRRTDARFDPTVLDALLDAGYDRTIDEVRAAAPLPEADRLAGGAADLDEPRHPVPGPVGIRLDAATRSVTLPAGVHLDLGGIGKGRAVDLAAEHLQAAGVRGGCVNLSGDVRVWGPAPGDQPWIVAIDDPFAPERDLTMVALHAGAVATSGRLRRAWQHGGAPAHHLIDPATGRPATSGLAAVTVVAEHAAWAEVLAKAAFVSGAGAGRELILGAGVEGLIVTDDGTLLPTPGFGEYEVRDLADDTREGVPGVGDSAGGNGPE